MKKRKFQNLGLGSGLFLTQTDRELFLTQTELFLAQTELFLAQTKLFLAQTELFLTQTDEFGFSSKYRPTDRKFPKITLPLPPNQVHTAMCIFDLRYIYVV